MSEELLRGAVCSVSRLLWDKGWVANHDGNVTARLEDGRLLATPTAVSKRLISPEHLLILSPEGKLLPEQRTSGKAFSELPLHLACYAAREDVRAVVHAHPPAATGFAVAGLPLASQVIAEAVVSLGPGAPLIPYARPGEKTLEQGIAGGLAEGDALLLANHGVIAVGVDLEQAFLRMELVEHLARITLAARQIGRVNHLPADDIAWLLERRAAAGLGPRARGKGDSQIAGLPPVEPPQSGRVDFAAIERAVREELVRLGLADR